MANAIAAASLVVPTTREQQAVDDFLARYTGATLARYAFDLDIFRRWCTANDVGPLDVTRGQLERYLRHLEQTVSAWTGRPLAQATIRLRLSVVACFLEFATLDGVIDRNPARRVRLPKIDREAQHRTWYELGDFHLLCKTARARGSLQDRAVILLLATVGLRVNELCQLDVDDLHIERGQAYVEYLRKGGKVTRPDLPLEVVMLLEQLAASRPGRSGPMFLTEAGNRMTRPAIQRIIMRLATAAGIGYKVTPHGMRRSFATAASMIGVPDHEIQQALYQVDGRQLPCYIRNRSSGSVARHAVATLLAG